MEAPSLQIVWLSTLPRRFGIFLEKICDRHERSGIAVQWNGGGGLRPWRFSYAFVALVCPFYIESEILIRFYYDLGASIALLLRFYCASTALLPFLLRFLSFCPKFRIVEYGGGGGGGG